MTYEGATYNLYNMLYLYKKSENIVGLNSHTRIIQARVVFLFDTVNNIYKIII